MYVGGGIWAWKCCIFPQKTDKNRLWFGSANLVLFSLWLEVYSIFCGKTDFPIFTFLPMSVPAVTAF